MGSQGRDPAQGGPPDRTGEVKPPPARCPPSPGLCVPAARLALLTGGGDRPYALGLSSALAAAGVQLDFIGSDEQDGPEVRANPRIRFLNLRGDQNVAASPWRKAWRVLAYYRRLLAYAVLARPRIFHILWNNKFELFDRTLLMLFYKLLGKKIVFTVHNVNARARDGGDSWLNRATLRFQYRRCDHIFVHTEKMKQELMADFGIPASRISIIPFGINDTVPNTALTPAEARRRVGAGAGDKTLLFFGNIAPYKGLEYLVAAFIELHRRSLGPPSSAFRSPSSDYRLVIAGRPKECEDYWSRIQRMISTSGVGDRIIQRIEHTPDEQTELYFKAADVLVLPYTHIFQSGVLFLGYSFGVPVIAADVGSLREEIVEGKTGFVFRPQDASDLAKAIEKYFASDLYRNLENRRADIRIYANERHSWTKVAAITTQVYSNLLKR